MPKSITRPSPSLSTMMLAGLRSRCTTPARCAARQPRRHAAGDDHHPRHRQLALALQDGRQVLAVDERHRDVLEAVDLADVVDADDVLVRDLAGEQQLLLEPLLEHPGGLRVGGHFGADGLERHRNAELGVPGLVHGAHAARAQQLDDVIALAEILADEIGGQLAEAAVACSGASAGRPGVPRHWRPAARRPRRRRRSRRRRVGVGRTASRACASRRDRRNAPGPSAGGRTRATSHRRPASRVTSSRRRRPETRWPSSRPAARRSGHARIGRTAAVEAEVGHRRRRASGRPNGSVWSVGEPAVRSALVGWESAWPPRRRRPTRAAEASRRTGTRRSRAPSRGRTWDRSLEVFGFGPSTATETRAQILGPSGAENQQKCVQLRRMRSCARQAHRSTARPLRQLSCAVTAQ